MDKKKTFGILGASAAGIIGLIIVFYTISWLFFRLLFAVIGFIAGLIVGIIWMRKRAKRKEAQTTAPPDGTVKI